MTGKELMLYILENDLLDEEIIQDCVPIFLMSIEEAAAKFNVGPSTIQAWTLDEKIKYEYINDRVYIYCNATDPRK